MRLCEVCGSARFSFLFEKEQHRFVRCDSCALERIDPQPTDEVLAQVYGKHYYDSWGLERNEEQVRALKRATFSYVLGRVGAPRGKLLDCGAATGFLMELARDLGFDAYGVELSDFGAESIAKRFGKDHVFRGQLQDAPFPRRELSVITMCDYIEHVRDPREVLEKASSLLAADGTLAITTPDTGSLSRRLLATGWTHYKIEHLYYFRRDNLRRLLTAAGFDRVKFYPLVKRLNLKYIREQLETYPHPLLSRAARGLGRVTPDVLQSQMLPFLTGELLAVARRPA